jgi:DNA-binding NtrC family response regulator
MKEAFGAETSSDRTVALLFVSPSKADHAVLRSILQEAEPNVESNSRWLVHLARNISGTLELLSREEIPIVVSDDNLHPGAWQAILDLISALPDPPLLIVASHMADERLWSECLNLGAWDVLAKPFDRQEVLRVVAAAWRHWADRRNRQAGQSTVMRGTKAV